jgi:hypothetical protein
MTLNDVSLMVLILAGLATVRFGIPMLVMWVLKMGCCRIFKLTPQ